MDFPSKQSAPPLDRSFKRYLRFPEGIWNKNILLEPHSHSSERWNNTKNNNNNNNNNNNQDFALLLLAFIWDHTTYQRKHWSIHSIKLLIIKQLDSFGCHCKHFRRTTITRRAIGITRCCNTQFLSTTSGLSIKPSNASIGRILHKLQLVFHHWLKDCSK